MNDLTILVTTCDKYKDAWEPFFKPFNTYWENCPYKIVFNTEKISCENMHNNLTNFNCNKKWLGVKG